MTLSLDYPPLPGTWVTRAQDALDVLSKLTTTEEVIEEFGTTRTLVEAVLGTAAVGGSATRRAIRATGRLLTHRLSPGLAAEALSWAASAMTMISASAVEEFLEAAANSDYTCRPLHLDERYVLEEHLTRHQRDAARRSELEYLWRIRDHHFEVSPSVRGSLSSFGNNAALLDLVLDDPDDRPFNWSIRYPWDCDPTPPITLDLLLESGVAQMEQFRHFEPEVAEEVAADQRLFELTEAVVARCLLEHTATVLENPACPTELRDRVRYPYDVATLELAIRAGVGHFEPSRARRVIEQLDDTEHRRFMEVLRWPYVKARVACGLDAFEARDAAVALASGHYWASQCPGIPASSRPAASIPTVLEMYCDLGSYYVDGDPSSSRKRGAYELFEYPDQIEALQGHYHEAPGWTVTLPSTPAELAANAAMMRNCTAGFDALIEPGRAFIVIIEDPTGRRYNAAVIDDTDTTQDETHYRVGQVNSWANGGEKPSWIAPAINARLKRGVRDLDLPEPPERCRRPRRLRRRTSSRPRVGVKRR